MNHLTSEIRLKHDLQLFGCSQRESDIYLLLLRSGPQSVQSIARAVGYNRVTVHDSVKQLIERGLLFETRKGKRRLIVAESAEIFERVLERERGKLQTLESSLQPMLKRLSELSKSDSAQPSVRFYEGVDGFKRMLEETLSARGEVLVFTYVDLFSKLLDPDYLENYFIRRARRDIYTRLIFPHCDFADRVQQRSQRYKITVRRVPQSFHWRSGVFSWNDSLAIKSFTDDKLTCTIIENRDISEFFRNVVFELLWSGLSE